MELSTEVAPHPDEPSPEIRAPDEPSSRTSSFAFRLGAIALGGAVLRVVYTVAYRDASVFSDGVHYSVGARYVAEGRGFINPLSLAMTGATVQDGVHPPGWTLVLAAFAKIGLGTDLEFRLVAAAVGVATIVMVGLAAREAFGSRVALIAAGLTAVYPNIWLYEHELVSEPLALLGLATLMFLTYRFRRTPGPWLAAALGFVVAICALTRAELILLSLLVVVPVIVAVRTIPFTTRVLWLVFSGLGCLALIGPWFAYNTTRFDAPVPLSAGLGSALAAGNCVHTFDPAGENFAYFDFGCVLYTPVQSEDPAVADNQRRDYVLSYIGKNKGQFAVTSVARVGRAFNVYAPFQQVQFETQRGTESWVVTLGMFAYWVMLPFAVYGFVVARRRKVPVYPLMALLVVVFITVFATIGAVRYRAPAEITLVVLAAVGIDQVARLVAARRAERNAVVVLP